MSGPVKKVRRRGGKGRRLSTLTPRGSRASNRNRAARSRRRLGAAAKKKKGR